MALITGCWRSEMKLSAELNAKPLDEKAPDSIALAAMQSYQYWDIDGSALVINVLVKHNPSLRITDHAVHMGKVLRVSWTTEAVGPVCGTIWPYLLQFRVQGLTPYRYYEVEIIAPH